MPGVVTRPATQRRLEHVNFDTRAVARKQRRACSCRVAATANAVHGQTGRDANNHGQADGTGRSTTGDVPRTDCSGQTIATD